MDALLVRLGAADEGRRGRLVAALLSALLWPGAGQAYRRRYGKGMLIAVFALLILVAWAVVAALGIAQAVADAGPDVAFGALPGLVLAGVGANLGALGLATLALFALWVYAVVDAAWSTPKRVPSQPSTRA